MSRKALLLVLLALLPGPAVAEEVLGRLFFTPAQRNTLDAGKQLATPKGKRVVQGPPSVRVDGVVTRSDGESVIWINGKPVNARDASGVRAKASRRDPAEVEVRVPGLGRPADVRVGQTLDTASGTVDRLELYNDPDRPPKPRPLRREPVAEPAPLPPAGEPLPPDNPASR